MTWNNFDASNGSRQILPPIRRWVLCAIPERTAASIILPPTVAAGYLKYAAGDKECPYFVVPGVGGSVIAWCDCLGDGFTAPRGDGKLPMTQEREKAHMTKREPRIFRTRTEVQRALVNEPGLRVENRGGGRFVCDDAVGIVRDDDARTIAMVADGSGPWTEVLTPRRWGPWEEVERFEDADDAGMVVSGVEYRACVSEWQTGEWNTTSRSALDLLPEHIHWVRRWRL